MIDIDSEQLLTLAEAAREVPGRRHAGTLSRWWRKAVHGVRLETVLVGGRRFTSLEAIRRFIERLSEPRPADEPPKRRSRQGA